MTDQNTEKRPKVSVLMITYNHEKYIEQAVRSVMMQEADFDYELIIGEDCSTDNTREIVLQLKEEFPDKIRLLLHPQNIGMIPNSIATYNARTGEYIALCEGDDYWTHPKKLQIQVDYMENNKNCVVCNHSVTVIYEDEPTKSYPSRLPDPNSFNDIRGIFSGAHTHTSSLLIRNLVNLPDWFADLQASSDWALLILILLTGGEIGSIPGDPMSVYRRNQGGVTFDRSINRRLTMLKDAKLFTNNIRSQVSFKIRRYVISPMLYERHLGLYRLYIQEADYRSARNHALFMLFHSIILDRHHMTNALKSLVNSFPRLSRVKKITVRFYRKEN